MDTHIIIPNTSIYITPYHVYNKHSEVPTFDSHEAHKHELQNIRNAITLLLQQSPPLHVAHIPFSQQVIKNSTHHGPNWTSSYMHMVSFPWCLKGIEHKYVWMRLSQLHYWVMVSVKSSAQKEGDRRKGPAAKLKLGTCTLSWSFNNELSILGLIAHSWTCLNNESNQSINYIKDFLLCGRSPWLHT